MPTLNHAAFSPLDRSTHYDQSTVNPKVFLLQKNLSPTAGGLS